MTGIAQITVLQDKDGGIYEVPTEDLERVIVPSLSWVFRDKINQPLPISGPTLEFFIGGTTGSMPHHCLMLEMKYLISLGLNAQLSPYKEISEEIIHAGSEVEKEELISLYYVLAGSMVASYEGFIKSVSGVSRLEFSNRVAKFKKIHELRAIRILSEMDFLTGMMGFMGTKSLVLVDGVNMNHMVEYSVLQSQSNKEIPENRPIKIDASPFAVSIFVDILYKIYKGMYYYALEYKFIPNNLDALDSIIMNVVSIIKTFEIRIEGNYQAALFIQRWT